MQRAVLRFWVLGSGVLVLGSRVRVLGSWASRVAASGARSNFEGQLLKYLLQRIRGSDRPVGQARHLAEVPVVDKLLVLRVQ